MRSAASSSLRGADRKSIASLTTVGGSVALMTSIVSCTPMGVLTSFEKVRGFITFRLTVDPLRITTAPARAVASGDTVFRIWLDWLFEAVESIGVAACRALLVLRLIAVLMAMMVSFENNLISFKNTLNNAILQGRTDGVAAPTEMPHATHQYVRPIAATCDYATSA